MTDEQHQPLAGKVAIVTGASRGIGLAVARRFVAEGARVCITARNEDTLAEVAATFDAEQIMTVAGKADNPEHQQDVMNQVAERFGGLDILVNNAGINPVYGDLVDVDLGAARKVFEVNVLGALAWTQAAVKHQGLSFTERKGSIVNLSSVTGINPSPGIGVYGVSKAAIMHLTTTLAAELGPSIRVNAVAPAVVKTQFAEALFAENEAEVTAEYPLKRLGEPEDIANAVFYLVSPDAAWVSGHTLVVDGGLLTVGGRA